MTAAEFGAIRRAARVARGNDADARNHGKIARRLEERDKFCPTAARHRRSEYVYKGRADAIRYAILVAINSPYATLLPHQSRRTP